MQTNAYKDAVALFGIDKVKLAMPTTNEPLYNLKSETYDRTGRKVITVYTKTIEKPFQLPFIKTDINGIQKRDDQGNVIWYDPMSSKGAKRKVRSTRTVEETETVLKRSNARSVRKLEHLIMANPWQFWGTLTFDPKKHPFCTDLDMTKSVVEKWLNNFKSRKAPKMERLLVYERMTKKKPYKWHVHLFLFGVDSFMIRTEHKDKHGAVYHFEPWQSKFGFTKFIDVSNKPHDDMLSIARYISKYMFKDVDGVPNKKRFQASIGLNQKPRTTYSRNPQPLESYFNNAMLVYHHKKPIRNDSGIIINYAYTFTVNDEV